MVESDRDATRSVLQDLVEEEPYFIRMKGVGEGGHGVLSPVIQVTTEKKRRYTVITADCVLHTGECQ